MRTPQQRRWECDFSLLLLNVWCAALAVLDGSKTIIVAMVLITLIGWTVLVILTWYANRLERRIAEEERE